MKTLNLDKAGFKLAHDVLVLHKERFFKRDQRVLEEALVNTSIDAGRAVAEVQITPAPQQGKAACRALDSVNRLVFILYLLKDEGVFGSRKITPVINHAQEVRNCLQEYIAKDCEAKRRQLAPQPPRYVPNYAPGYERAPRYGKPASYVHPDGYDDLV